MSIQNELNNEIDSRIKTMNDSAYDFGPPLNKQDYIGIIVTAVICVLGVIWGM